MSEVLGLKNINMLSKEQYDGIEDVATDELYAISGSGAGFPSNRYDDLTLGASGATYVAPDNGFFFCKGNSTASNQDVWADTDGIFYSSGHSANSGNGLSCFFPVKKGQHVKIQYTCNMVYIRFIYAEGE